MKTQPGPSKPHMLDEAGELRRRAELRLSGHAAKPPLPRTEVDNQRQVHELEVHQVELEMQNEELEVARGKLEALLEKYTDLYDFAPVGYLTLTPNGDIRESNLTAASLLGVVRSALVGRRFGLFVLPAEVPVFTGFLERVFATPDRQSCEVTIKLEDRPTMTVELEAIVFESGEACRVTLTDITERRQAEVDRLVLNKLESTGILAAGIAHDFNNLFTIILLNLELAQKVTQPGEALTRHLETARQTSLLARGLTAQLVTFAEGGAPVRRATFLSGVIQQSVRPALSGSNVRCEFSLAEDLWVAEVDAGQLGQVIRNLALNAREAMSQGGVVYVRAENVVLVDQEVPALPAGDYVRISLADQGSGIAADVLPKIFDPYFSTKQRGPQKGMGLGLTICHAVIQKHQGTITVRSEVGVGTTFHIYLPAARNLNGEEELPTAKAMMRPAKLLLMDDEEEVRKIIGLALWGMGHQVEQAENGSQAVALYQTAMHAGRPFDAVILDLTVRGGMGGQETIQSLLKMDPAVQGIAMSGYVKDPAILEPERHGFKGMLAKPFDLGKLQETLARVLGQLPQRKAVA